MKMNCNIIRDLLPLYVEGIASEESRELVEEHLEECGECRERCECMKCPQPQPPVQQVGQLKRLKRVLLQHTLSIVMIVVFLTVAAMILIQGLFFVKPDEAFGYTLLCFYLILPVTAFVCSLVLGLGKSAIKWFAPIVFGGIGVLLPMFFFRNFDGIALFFALIPSLIGLGLGSIIFFSKRAWNRRKRQKRVNTNFGK